MGGSSVRLLSAVAELSGGRLGQPNGGPNLQDLTEIATFRDTVTPNTLTIIGPALDLGDYPNDLAYGPDIYHVRTLP